VLTNVDAYPERNPFIRSIEGDPGRRSPATQRGFEQMNQALKRRTEVAS
jgi:hypothetical protein